MKAILGALLVLAFGPLLGNQSAVAAEELPETFAECVFAGGDIGRMDGEVSCRFVQTNDLRIYGSVETECGERVDIEIWDVIRDGVMTYPFSPARTRALPELGDALANWPPASPIPCHKD